MFQTMKIHIPKNKANRTFITEKYFSGKVLFFADFPHIQSKFLDNSLIFQ